MSKYPKYAAFLTAFLAVACESAPPRPTHFRASARPAGARALRLADNPVARMEIIQGMRRNPLAYCPPAVCQPKPDS